MEEPLRNEKHMKAKSKEEKTDDLRPEYELRELLEVGVQGKYAGRYREGTNVVLLDEDVAEAFPTDESVNEALRLVIQLTKLSRPDRGKKPDETASGSR